MSTASAAPPSVSEGPGAAPYSRRFVALMVFVLGVLAATGPLSTDLYLPAMPAIAADLNAPESLIQLTLTASMVGLAVGQLIVGPMSDTWGRRAPLLVGITAFTLTSFAIVFVPSGEVFVVLRFLQGFAGAAGAVIARAVVRDLFEGEEVARFMSRLILIIGLAPMVGPILGGQLLLVGSWRLMFVVLGLSGVLSLLLVAFLLPESLPAEERRPQRPKALLRTFRRLFTAPSFIVPTMILALAFGMMFTYIASFSFVAQSGFGASPQIYSLIFAVNTVGLILGTQVNAWLIGRVQVHHRLGGGLVLALAAVAGMTLLSATDSATLPLLNAMLFMVLLGVGFVMPNSMTLAIATQPPQIAGTASALIGSLQFAAGGAIGALAGFTATGEPTLMSMSVVMIIAGSLAALLFVWKGREQRV